MSIAGTNILGTIGNFAGQALNGSQSSGGSISNAGGSNWGYNTAQSAQRAQSQSKSQTYGSEATYASAQQAKTANKVQDEYLKRVMQYNAEQAMLQRDWEEKMANTIYTRSIKNMKEAGINPILAAGMGLSGASVGSGATASVSTPSAFMGQTFADQNSASNSYSMGDSFSHGENGGSWGSSSSSWTDSESGLATGLKQMEEYMSSVANSINTGLALKENESYTEAIGRTLKEQMKNDTNKTKLEEILAKTDNTTAYYMSKFINFMDDLGLGQAGPMKWINGTFQDAKKILEMYQKK